MISTTEAVNPAALPIPDRMGGNPYDAPAGVQTRISMATMSPSIRIVWILRLLSLVALAVSSYLAWTSWTGSKIAGCGGGLWDCDHVTSTRWSTWFKIPVGFGAAGLYVACLTALACANSLNETRRIWAWRLITIAGLTAGLAAVWFISLQVLAIGHLCKWCLVAHGCGLTIAGIVLWRRPASPNTLGLSAVSVAGIAVLVGGQLAYAPPKFEIVEEEPYVENVASPSMMSNEDMPPGMGAAVDAPPGIGVESDVPPGAETDLPPFAGMESDAPPGAETDLPPIGETVPPSGAATDLPPAVETDLPPGR